MNTATATKTAIVSSFTVTIAALSLALCFTPAINMNMSARMMPMAGRLTIPPAAGPLVKYSGNPIPIAVSALLKYPLQPLATAATETPYSRIKSQPMIQAMTSPKAA